MKLIFILIFALLSVVSGDSMAEQFVSEQAHFDNLERQVTMTPKTLKQLRSYGVSRKTHLRLEYFFYTNQESKAEALNKALVKLGYDSKFGISAESDSLYLVTGWTSPIQMSKKEATSWTAEMCKLGYRHDAGFDGWGTNPDQG